MSGGYNTIYFDEEDQSDDEKEEKTEQKGEKKKIKIRRTRASRHHSLSRRSSGVAMAASATGGAANKAKFCILICHDRSEIFSKYPSPVSLITCIL